MKALKDVLNQDDAVIFLGSGISQWSGLPSWWGLISQLADYLDYSGIDSRLVKLEAEDGDLLQAASYGFAKLTRPQIAEFIRRAVKLGKASPSEIHRKIVTLGPTCFITTNYDDLLEQALAKWCQGQSFRRPIINRQIVEQAEIQNAQARKFIFKPHGDANDSESIILTREQYRMLLPGGDYGAALDTLKTLLTTRPVLFLGFGLKDPDFLYVRDVLANLYRGGVRDHYAVIPDATNEHTDYWRNSYGIHLLGYKTRPNSLGGKDHTALLDLLDQIREGTPSTQAVVSSLNLADAGTVLSLARYAAGLATSPIPAGKFSIRVRGKAESQKSGRIYFSNSPFDGLTVDRFLVEGPARAVLTGSPGAGKTFAMVNAAKSLATQLQDACIQNRLDASIVVPVLMDLKLYRGQLLSDIAALFPPGLTLEGVSKLLPVKLFLDAFNEMPREYIEKGTFTAEVQQLALQFPQLSIIVGSRTADSLGGLEWATYDLSEIPKQEVEEALLTAGLVVPETQREDILDILQRPFYFRLLNSSAVVLRDVIKPADLYAQYMEHIRKEFVGRFGTDVDIIGVMERQAYRMLEDGTEAFLFDQLMEDARSQMVCGSHIDLNDVKNWLASRGIVIPQVGDRGSFAHQSITEFLAARELVQRLQIQKTDLRSVVTLRRWDHVIFLAISLMDAPLADAMLDELLRYDVSLAINSARFVENRQIELLDRVLRALQAMPEDKFGRGTRFVFGKLPFQKVHEKSLRQLLSRGGELAVAVLGALANLLGPDFKAELLARTLKRSQRYDRTINEAAELLAPLISEKDVPGLVARALALGPKAMDDENGDTSDHIDVLARILQAVPLTVLREEVFAKIENSPTQHAAILARLISRIGWYSRSPDMFLMLNELLIKGHRCATFPAYSMAEHYSGTEPLPLFQVDSIYLSALAKLIQQGDEWATELVKVLCGRDKSIAEQVRQLAQKRTGTLQNILSYCASGIEQEIFSVLEKVAEKSSSRVSTKTLGAVRISELDWTGREALFMTLLNLKNVKITKLILGHAVPVTISGLSQIDMGDPTPWLKWISKLSNPEGWWTQFQICFLLGQSARDKDLELLVSHLGDEDSSYRGMIAKWVLPHASELSIDQLSENAIEYLFSNLKGKNASEFDNELLGAISTEKFVVDRLLPWSQRQSPACQANVRRLTEDIGRRLGRRFLFP